MTLVLDASVALTWLFPDENSRASETVFRNIYLDGAYAPVMLPIEIANALNVGLRRGRLSVEDWHRGVAVIQSLPLAIDAFSSTRTLNEVAAMAQRHELSVYDAMYLELASRRRLPLATFDGRLRDVAQQIRIQLAISSGLPVEAPPASR